ncbi:MAG: pyruvate carboxylase [Planctomycetota bacterium]
MAPKSIRKLMCANRGEIAIRVFRAATELGIRTVAIFSNEDRVHLHRYKADEAYLVGAGKTPVAAYLDIEGILKVARENQVDAIHPGYGFLSERAEFARRCAAAGIIFVGPTPEVLSAFGDKISARRLAIACGVPVIPGTPNPVDSLDQAREFIEARGLPVMLKAAHGGGGRGMRVVRRASELNDAFLAASSEASAAFGDGTLFLERYVERPRHIEVQILGDNFGNVVHLYERDCSVQRRHQKLIELAPAVNLPAATRERLLADALTLAHHVHYSNAGTVEFLVDAAGQYYFIEVNPRIQVEHTVTEQVTGVDLVQSQIRLAEGASLAELGLTQENVRPRGFAIQCRVTTEDPERGFAPDTGTIEVYRSGSGMGIRLDGGSGYSGAEISPHYDPLLVKVTGYGRDFEATVARLRRALTEFRIRGVKSNIPFLMRVLEHPRFHTGEIDTTFVDSTPELFVFPRRRNRAQKLLRYLGEVIVNGPQLVFESTNPPAAADPVAPVAPLDTPLANGWRPLLLEHGARAFAAAVRAHPGLLMTDTTWRDAHQSLLATRVRTRDLLVVAPATAHALAPAFSLEMWGGATFDVALRFLKECPWQRLEALRACVPHIPFQMLLRGANAVGYTSYPDNVVVRFIRESHRRGIDVFRVFDSLNDLDNMRVAIDAIGETGAVVEAALCYTGDVSDPKRTKYTLDYYLELAGRLVDAGTHILAVKDMAGLLKPTAATRLVAGLRAAFPAVPIHLHTHDTAGAGVAAMLAGAEAGADIVDAALPSMAGFTSQPSIAAIVATLKGGPRDTGLDLRQLQDLNLYWEQVRELYAPFESSVRSGSADVYEHEMPGGQYTNLKFQAQALGLKGRWTAIVNAYSAANRLLGDVIKVTPTSKVVGDLAQFMVQNKLSEVDVLERAETLSFPSSVVDFMRGSLGQPYGGFPEPLRTKVLRGEKPHVGRPGASMKPFDFDALAHRLRSQHGIDEISELDLLSAALYPEVFDEFLASREKFSDLSVLPTRCLLAPMRPGEEVAFDIERGKTLIVRMAALGDQRVNGERAVYFELNGQPRTVIVADRSLKAGATTTRAREVADRQKPGQVGAPMPGTVSALKIEVGQAVAQQDALASLSAMKLETIVRAPVGGRVQRITVQVGDALKAGELMLEIEPVNSNGAASKAAR